MISHALKVLIQLNWKQFVPQRFIFSPWFTVGWAVLIKMLCNFIHFSCKKLKYELIWHITNYTDGTPQFPQLWRNSSFDLLINVPISRFKNKYEKLRKNGKKTVFIPNLVASNWKGKHKTEHPEYNMVPSDTNAHILMFPEKSQWDNRKPGHEKGRGSAWGHETPPCECATIRPYQWGITFYFNPLTYNYLVKVDTLSQV